VSRKKKVRSAGNADVIVVRQRSERELEGRLRKKLKKRKGLKSGNRHSNSTNMAAQSIAKMNDPRIGSKKKIPLILEPSQEISGQERQIENAEQALAALENDAQLNVLLDRLERGEKLGAGLQQYVDEKLERIEQLMTRLGLLEEDEAEDESLTPPGKGNSRTSQGVDEKLLDEFDSLEPDDFQP
jgi:ribosome assembly protein YihI (activator of Der GTPase)